MKTAKLHDLLLDIARRAGPTDAGRLVLAAGTTLQAAGSGLLEVREHIVAGDIEDALAALGSVLHLLDRGDEIPPDLAIVDRLAPVPLAGPTPGTEPDKISVTVRGVTWTRRRDDGSLYVGPGGQELCRRGPTGEWTIRAAESPIRLELCTSDRDVAMERASWSRSEWEAWRTGEAPAAPPDPRALAAQRVLAAIYARDRTQDEANGMECIVCHTPLALVEDGAWPDDGDILCTSCLYEDRDTLIGVLREIAGTVLEEAHTAHCRARLAHGDGICECGARSTRAEEEVAAPRFVAKLAPTRGRGPRRWGVWDSKLGVFVHKGDGGLRVNRFDSEDDARRAAAACELYRDVV